MREWFLGTMTSRHSTDYYTTVLCKNKRIVGLSPQIAVRRQGYLHSQFSFWDPENTLRDRILDLTRNGDKNVVGPSDLILSPISLLLRGYIRAKKLATSLCPVQIDAFVISINQVHLTSDIL